MQFQIKRAVNSQYYWVLKGTNGEVVAQSETYTTKQSAEHGIDVVRSGADRARVVDLA